MNMANTVRSALASHGVDFELVAHPRTHSSKESAAAASVPDDHLAKAVLLKDGAGYVMVVVPASHHVRLHTIQRELDRPLELATEGDISRLFEDCRPGAIPPLGAAYGIETVVDQALTSLATVYFEAGDHEHLLAVCGDDFRRLLGGARHAFVSHPGGGGE